MGDSRGGGKRGGEKAWRDGCSGSARWLELRQLTGKFAPLKPPEGDESGCNGNNESRPDEELKLRFDAVDEDTGEDKEKDCAGAHVSFETRTVEVDLVARAEAPPSLSHNLHLSSMGGTNTLRATWLLS